MARFPKKGEMKNMGAISMRNGTDGCGLENSFHLKFLEMAHFSTKGMN